MPGNDANTKLLLHCDGADTSTTFTDASVAAHGNAGVNGTAQVDTSTKVFGTGSLSLDGDSDWLTYADSGDWDFLANNTDSWTIDMRVKLDQLTGDNWLIGQSAASNAKWVLFHRNGNGLWGFSDGRLSFSGGEITDSNWHHVAIIKVANEFGTYLDGVQGGYGTGTGNGTYAGQLMIGRLEHQAQLVDGHMDEIRIQKDNYFGAAPNAGKTDTITVPSYAYSDSPDPLFIPPQGLIIA